MAKNVRPPYIGTMPAMELNAMKTLIIVSTFAMTAALCLLYQVGSPRYGFEDALKLLPVLVLMMAIVPIVLLKTKCVDRSNKDVVRAACCLALVMPFCLWQVGYILVMQIASVGGCFGG
jgi:hypothetical protein